MPRVDFYFPSLGVADLVPGGRSLVMQLSRFSVQLDALAVVSRNGYLRYFLVFT